MRSTLTVLACVALAACSSGQRQDIPVQMGLPPMGLASTAIWLEEREGSSPRVVEAREIPTSQIRAVAEGGTPVAATTVAQPAAAVPDRARPPSTVGLAAQAFADTCVASLPSMDGTLERLRQVSQRDFGVAPSELGSNWLITGQRPGNIQLEATVGVGRQNINQCLVSVRREDPAVTANALVGTVTGAGYSLRPIPAENASQAWAIEGAPAGTELKINVRRNFAGQQLTGAWITWR